MIGSYFQYYGQGAGRVLMPMPIIIEPRSCSDDILIIWNLIRTRQYREAVKDVYIFFRKWLLPNLAMICLAGALLFFMILVSMKIHLLNGEKIKPEPIVIQPEIISVNKKEVKPVNVKPKKIVKKQVDIPIKKPPLKKDIIKPERKRVIVIRKQALLEKKIEHEFARPLRKVTEPDMQVKKEIVNIPIRSDGFNPVKKMETYGDVQKTTRQEIGLYTPKNHNTAYIDNSHIKSKREGLSYNSHQTQTTSRSNLNHVFFNPKSRGSAEGDLNIVGVSLESLEACPNPLDEIECKKRILKIIGERQKCSNSSGQYIFFKTTTQTSFGMLVKPFGGRKLMNRCQELDNACNCLKITGK